MTIEITHHGRGKLAYYRADCKDLPGSPPVGHGTTEAEAMAHLFHLILFANAGPGRSPHNWTYAIRESDPIMVNGVKWTWPKGAL